jgi:hypothetical protein
MIKKVLIFIIVFIIIYDIYLINNKNSTTINSSESASAPTVSFASNIKPLKKSNGLNNNINGFNYDAHDSNLITKNFNTAKIDNFTDIDTKTQHNTNTNTNTQHDINDNEETNMIKNNMLENNINFSMYGKPYDYKENEYIIWQFTEPYPWSKIVYIYNDKFPFKFHIKIKIPSLNDYQSWKAIISNIDFDPKSGEIIIPTSDEETALSIANLMVSHFKGEISMDDIIKKKLIDISIEKSRKYEVVKRKIVEQIMNNISEKKETFFDLKVDLAQDKEPEEFILKNDKTNEYNPYEGNEYSFI